MRKHNILIVDDEREVCVLLENYLLRKNQNVSYCTSLTDGLAKSAQMKPSVLILDHNMPDGFGIDNIFKFKELNSTLRVIVISAMSNLKDEALTKGADYFLEKPIKLSTLNSIITSN
ncbi:MAG: response regulator [Bacteroidetes bacterium]|nr:response regulator [Bacteroidota bacterium]